MLIFIIHLNYLFLSYLSYFCSSLSFHSIININYISFSFFPLPYPLNPYVLLFYLHLSSPILLHSYHLSLSLSFPRVRESERVTQEQRREVTLLQERVNLLKVENISLGERLQEVSVAAIVG